MTEEEARKQDCIGPEPCGIWQYEILSSRRAAEKTRRLCKGAACRLAWRWLPQDPEQGGYGDQPRPPGEGWYIVPRGSVSRWVRDLPPTSGYCGLASKP